MPSEDLNFEYRSESKGSRLVKRYKYKLLDYTSEKDKDEVSSLTNSSASSSMGAIGICRRAFESIHGLSTTKNKRLHKEINTGTVFSRRYGDRDVVAKDIIDDLFKCEQYVLTKDGIKKTKLSPDLVALAGLPNTLKYKKAYEWLKAYIDGSACEEPNGDKKSIERQTKRELWLTYSTSPEMQLEPFENILCLTEFETIQTVSSCENTKVQKRIWKM